MAFTSGSTPFGFFDGDSTFQVDADRVLTWVARRLGESHVQVELSSSDVYTAFEEATLEYSAIINSYQAKSSLAAWLGSPTGSMTGGENRYPQFNLQWQRRQADAYGAEAMVGGNAPLHSGSIQLVAGQQSYDLQALLDPTGSDGLGRRLVIRQIFHFSPLSAFRFFGTTSAINYLNNQFKFESYTPETIFYLLPIWEDILRGMQFETSNRVRRSNYSYELHNNVLNVYPPPDGNNPLNLYFTYQLADELGAAPDIGQVASGSLQFDRASHGVANLSNVPFGNIEYGKLNSLSRQWIWKMTLAICKETMGYIRRKMLSIPIPGEGGGLQLDGEQLVSDAKAEMEQLRGDLRGLLEETTYDRLAAREAEQAESLYTAMSRVPMKIYVGGLIPFLLGLTYIFKCLPSVFFA